MRLFYALEAAPDTRQQLADAAQCYKPLIEQANWTRQDNLHLTVHFLGEFPESALPLLTDVMQAATAGVTPFTMTVAGAGTFGRRGEILWLGLSDAPGQAAWAGQPQPPLQPSPQLVRHPLQRLYQQLQQALRQAGLPNENRPFVPHITIARSVRLKHRSTWPPAIASRLQATDHPDSLPALYQAFQWPVAGLSLMHSTRIDNQLTYLRLAHSPLTPDHGVSHGDKL